MATEEMRAKVAAGQGFIAALDQSGGSTPKALAMYGVDPSEYSGDEEMYDRVHEMRTRLMTSPVFDGSRVLGAILFEGTMDRTVAGLPTATYLWQERGVVPFVKVDQGLADEDADGVQIMKDMPGLDALLTRARDAGVFGTKMRSVIKRATPEGVQRVVDQQFAVGLRILAAGLVPILEPEVDINAPDKAEAEALLRDALLAGLAQVPDGQQVMFKLTLPEEDGFYAELVAHPKVLRVVALSGGYSREEANARLARNPGVIASVSRALLDGLTRDLDEAAFDGALDTAIAAIHAASIT
jgi:fructose-bisphosphate aldolase class I